MRARNALIEPRTLAPYFVLAGLVHAAAVASRFDALAAELPAGAQVAIMLVQFPLLYLSGYFERRLDYGTAPQNLPLWMRIDSRSVKFCFAFGFMYLVVVAAQTWDVSIGPIDPTPPKTFPQWQRAMWFTMFTAGAFMLFFMAAGALLLPVLRVLAWPLDRLPTIAAAILALAIGGGVGVVVLAAMQSANLATFVQGTKATITASPALFGVVIGVTSLGPLILGLVLERRRTE